MADDSQPQASTGKEDTSKAEKVKQTQAQLEAIEKEVRENQPLTSVLKPIGELKTVYDTSDASSKYFVTGVDYLSTVYQNTRMTRGDGSCYYRSFLYSLSEHLLKDEKELNRIAKYVKESNLKVINVGGYDEMAIDIFYEAIVEFFEELVSGNMTEEKLHSELTQENATSDYCTWYLRVLTATFLKSDPTRFLPYMEDGYMDIAAFCRTQIEPMGKECTMVSVLALAEAFQVRVQIEYLDGRPFEDKLSRHEFGPEDSATKLSLLYRPGHYDIIYAK